MSISSTCPCCSGKEYSICCQSYHSAKERPQTAEQLMRSRYAAYAFKLVDYLVETTHPSTAQKADRKAISEWAAKTTWLGLEVVRANQGQATDKMGKVEFKAFFEVDGEKHIHHELSRFRRHSGEWRYVDGVVY